MDKTTWGELEPEEGTYAMLLLSFSANNALILFTEEESEESEEESEEEEIADVTMEGTQTPSGLETPSGMASVVSTVAGGLETPDFLELRKNAARPATTGEEGPRSLYQVVPERQTNVRGLMGSERGYDVMGVSGQVPVLGDERGSAKVRYRFSHEIFSLFSLPATILIDFFVLDNRRRTELTYHLTHRSWKGCLKTS